MFMGMAGVGWGERPILSRSRPRLDPRTVFPRRYQAYSPRLMIAPVLVTGGTGFVGIALVRELTEHGYEVHVLARPSADRSVLADLPVQWHAGDLLDAASIERALEAVAACAGGAGPWLVHNAAVISYRTRDAALQREVNVEGTRRVLRAARKMGVTRAVHVSSVVAVGFSSRGETLDEGAPWNGAQLGLDYVTTKRAAEELALAAAEELDLRVVNPGAIFGPSPRPANTARFLRKIAAGALGPIAPPGVMSPVGLRDVATGIRLALERGRAGRRYLLCESTLSMKDLFRRAQALLELKPTRFALPRPLWSAAVAATRAVDAVRPLELTTPQALKALGVEWRFTGARARTELGWAPAPFEAVLTETLESLGLTGAANPRGTCSG